MDTFQLKSLKRFNTQLKELVASKLWAKVIAGLIGGVLLGLLLNFDFGIVSPGFKTQFGEWLTLPGQLFIRIVQMIVIPLVFSSIIRGVAGSDNMEQLRSLGLRLVGYFVFTTSIAIAIGTFVASLVRPGLWVTVDASLKNGSVSADQIDQTLPAIGLKDHIIGLLPQNPITAMNEGQLLQVVLFAIIVGLALIAMDSKKAEPILALLDSVQEVCMTVVKWAMYLAPWAVFGMTANTILSTGLDTLIGLAVYIGTVILGLGCMVIVYLLIVAFVGKMNPLTFLKKIFPVQLLAFSTSSSASVMPLSVKTAEEELGVSQSVAQFTIPLGATINMDGTALYQMIATMFLAQAFQIDLNMSQLLLLGITAVGASIGAPGTPGVGIVILATLLQSVGVPLAGISMILAVDRILDMSRTVVNVTGDLTATVVMQRFMKDPSLPSSSSAKKQ